MRQLAIRIYHVFLKLVGKSPLVSCYSLNMGRCPIPDLLELKSQYALTNLAREPETFILCRIIGNDLPPRHRKGQARANLAFILEYEPELLGCEKHFIVNRIVDESEEGAILEMLQQAGKSFEHIPFERPLYNHLTWDIEGVPETYRPGSKFFWRLKQEQQGRVIMRLYRHKNNYVMNNNGARNVALTLGRDLAKWVMPWDGNCFLTETAWHEIVQGVQRAPEIPYFIVPMARITDNTKLLDARYKPQAVEEPQIIFRKDTNLYFDEHYFYGRRPKVELLWRLGVPGKWDKWEIEPWDFPAPAFAEQAGSFATAGWVARLHSGQEHLEKKTNKASMSRMTNRVEAIRQFLNRLDEEGGNQTFEVAFPFSSCDRKHHADTH